MGAMSGVLTTGAPSRLPMWAPRRNPPRAAHLWPGRFAREQCESNGLRRMGQPPVWWATDRPLALDATVIGVMVGHVSTPTSPVPALGWRGPERSCRSGDPAEDGASVCRNFLAAGLGRIASVRSVWWL